MDTEIRDFCVFENKGNEKIIGFNITRSYLQHERPSIYE